MRIFVRLAAVAVALAVASPALAQQRTTGRGVKVGLGIGLPTDDLETLGNLGAIGNGTLIIPPQLYVPIVIAPNIRIEPQIGWVSDTDDENDEHDSAFTLGIGGLYLVPTGPQSQFYAGARLASTWIKDENRIAPATLQTLTSRNTLLAVVGGGEYLPSPSFSVGAEGQLAYVIRGDPEIEQTGAGTAKFQGGNLKAFRGVLFVRVYFN